MKQTQQAKMASTYATLTFGSLTLILDIITPKKVNHTKKTVIGGKLRMRGLPGTSLQDWSLRTTGRLRGTNRTTDRETLESYDDLKVHTWTDGIHNGDYFITSLEFPDDPNKPTTITFNLNLIQDQ